MSKSRRKLSKEFKSEIVQLVLSGNKTVPQVAKEHALHESSVYNWVRQAKIDDGQGPALSHGCLGNLSTKTGQAHSLPGRD